VLHVTGANEHLAGHGRTVTHPRHWNVVLNMHSRERGENSAYALLSSLCAGTPAEAQPSPLLDAERKHEKDSAGNHPHDKPGWPRSGVSHQYEASELYGSRCAEGSAINLHNWTFPGVVTGSRRTRRVGGSFICNRAST
jgi:hypothetical protein